MKDKQKLYFLIEIAKGRYNPNKISGSCFAQTLDGAMEYFEEVYYIQDTTDRVYHITESKYNNIEYIESKKLSKEDVKDVK